MLDLVHKVTTCPEGELVVPMSSRWQRRTIDPAGPFLIGTWTELWILIKIRLRGTYARKTSNGTFGFHREKAVRYGLCHVGGNPAYGCPGEPGAYVKHAFGVTNAYHEDGASGVFESFQTFPIDTTHPGGYDGVRHLATGFNETYVNNVESANGGIIREFLTAGVGRKCLIYRFTRPNNTGIITQNGLLSEDTLPTAVAIQETPLTTLAEWFRDNDTWANLTANRPTNWSVGTSTSASIAHDEPTNGIWDTVYFCGGSDGWIPELSLFAMKTPA